MNKWKLGLFISFVSITIAEYTTGSTPLTEIITDPFTFFIFSLPSLLGLYGCGVVLIREAAIVWNKGWPTILFLGLAYGIMEEGVAVHTFFDPVNATVGIFGQYGRMFNIDITWAIIISIFHSVFSIALPIMISGLLFPRLKDRRLLRKRSLIIVLLAYLTTVTLLDIIAPYRPSLMYTAFLLTIALTLIYIAKRLPKRFFKRNSHTERKSVAAYFALGIVFFPILIFVTRMEIFLPSAILDLEVIAVTVLIYRVIETRLSIRSEMKLGFLILGLTIPLMFFGVIVSIRQNPLGIIAIFALALIDYRVLRLTKIRELMGFDMEKTLQE